jgi:hypothetical protein
MAHRKDGTLVDAGVFTLIERCIYFSFGSQPVCHRITTIEATMFGIEIGCNGNLIVMLRCLMVMLGCLAIDGSLFMQSFCSVYVM